MSQSQSCHVSYESLVRNYNLSERQLQVECSENVFRVLAKNLTKWRNLEPYLELGKGVLDAIDHESLDEEGKRRELLGRWRESYGPDATCEKLIRCLLNASRADLADAVLKELVASAGVDKANSTTGGNTHSPSTVMSGACKAFVTTAEPEENVPQYSQGGSRDIPPNQNLPVATLGPMTSDQMATTTVRLATDRDQMAINSSRQEQTRELPGRSDLVASQSVTHPMTPKTPDILSTILSLFSQEKEEKTDMARRLKIKKNKVKELKQRKDEVEGFLTEKMEKISRMEEEANKVQGKLDVQKKRLQDSEEDLKQKESNMTRLRDDVSHKETELKREKEEKKEKQEQMSVLEDQLQHAKSDLEKERGVKDSAKKELEEASNRIEALQRDVEKANRDVKVTREEREKIERVLEWTEDDLDEEKDEVTELSRVLTRQREILITYRCILVFLLAILAGLLLHNVGVLQ